MKAAVVTSYGGPEVLQLQECPRTESRAGANPCTRQGDRAELRGHVRPAGRLPRDAETSVYPGNGILRGCDRCGRRSTHFSPGDRVMGFSKLGSHAEQVVLSEDKGDLFSRRQ